jgi:hypothetical protein
MTIDLQTYMGRESCFRILPKFRIRTEGEAVRLGDAIILQSVRTEGYLNVGRSMVFNESVGCEIREASSSNYTHGWTVRLFKSVSHELSSVSRLVTGGRFIRLYHKEREGYLGCPPFLTLARNTFEMGGTNDHKVQLVDYKFDSLNPQDSTSSLVMWQIEYVDSYSGDLIEWGQPVRFRHAATNLYLSVIEDNSFTLPSGEKYFTVDLKPIAAQSGVGDDPTLFTISSVNSESGNILAGAFLRIQNVATRSWLRVIAKNTEDGRGRQFAATTTQGFNIKIRGGESLFHLVATLDLHQDDCKSKLRLKWQL